MASVLSLQALESIVSCWHFIVPVDDEEKEIIERAYIRRMKRQKIEKELKQAERNQ